MDRLQELYKRKLVPSEAVGKELPLQKILEKNLIFWPEPDLLPETTVLEIGPGNGEFLVHMALHHPQKKFVAVELGKPRFEKIKDKLIKGQMKNVQLAHGDARVLVWNHLKDDQLDEVFILFPDPWPKTKHSHQRLLQLEFIKKLTDKMKVGATLTLATDVGDYARWAVKNFKASEKLVSDLDPEISSELPEIIPTYFKRKWDKMGRDFFYCRFKKVG